MNEFSERDFERCQCGHLRIGHLQGFGACLRFLSGIHHGASCDCKKFESESKEQGIANRNN